MGETANGRTGKARIRAAGAMSLWRFMRPSETDWTNAVSPPRPFAVSPPGLWLLAPFQMSESSSLPSHQPKLFLRFTQVFQD